MRLLIGLLLLLPLLIQAEAKKLLDEQDRVLYFNDGSVYKLSNKYAEEFKKEKLGATMDVIKLARKEMPNRQANTRVVGQHGIYYAKMIAKPCARRENEFQERFSGAKQTNEILVTKEESQEIIKEAKELSGPSTLVVKSQEDRIITLSDGTQFEAQTLLPQRMIEGETIVIQEIIYFLMKTKPGEKILLKKIIPQILD